MQDPLAHVAGIVQTLHARPFMPQAVFKLPAAHVFDISQQPNPHDATQVPGVLKRLQQLPPVQSLPEKQPQVPLAGIAHAEFLCEQSVQVPPP